MNNLIKYLKENKVVFNKLSEEEIEIDSKILTLIIPNEDGLLFDDNFHLICDETDKNGYIYKFGGKYYFTLKGDEKKVKLNPLKYIGKVKESVKTHFFLGIRGGFELLNGSRLYKDWVKKAKFFNISSLGICEKNTLAGVLKFQLECSSNGIKSIIGETITVLREKEDFRYDLKCYVKDSKGWENLLLINKELNVVNNKYIKEEDLLKLTEGLFIVIDPKSLPFEKVFPIDLQDSVFYQLDTVEYELNDRDRDYLQNLKKYVKSSLKPIAITDAFYLDKEDFYIKNILNSIAGKREYKAVNQYFKSKQDYFYELDSLFNPEDESFDKLFNEAIRNEKHLANNCNFQIEVGTRRVAKYEMTEEERELYLDNEDLFWFLIEEGLKLKCPKGKEKEYINRIETEVEVIKLVNGSNGATGIDYFLILWDIVRWCKENDVLVGHSRGSSAGALIAYCLHITQIDPIKNKLFFERFLNPGRASKSTPDIDIDVMPSRKEDVKKYIRSKYGEEYFCYVGTNTTYQIKAAIKDLAKQDNLDFGDVNYVSTVLDLKKGNIEELFENGSQKKAIKKFIKSNPTIINDISLILAQPKSASIHACATIIFPKENNIFTSTPVRLVEENGEKMLISEWSGKDLETFGALKMDILVIDRLDKDYQIIKTIKEKYGVEIDYYNLDLTDEKVLDFFRKGYCQDIFQFGTNSFISYLKKLQPCDFEELVDAVALLRPGAMEVNSHNEYILRKFGEREITYKYGTEEITKNTKGLLIVQEQIMSLCQKLGGFSLAEADDVRKSIGRKDLVLMEQQKEKFIKGALLNGCPKTDAYDIWHDIEVHGSYSFNLSHSVGYTNVSWVGMYLKVYYPIVFWSVAFNNDKDNKNSSNYINEINKSGSIKIMPPDINKSFTSVYTDFSNDTIYWALSSIKMCGETSTDQIIEERNKNGEYFSLDEFLERHSYKGSKVNKRVIENLITSGVFDEIENIEYAEERFRLIQEYRKRNKVKTDDEKDIYTDEPNIKKEWWWKLQQKRLSGISFFDYKSLCKEHNFKDYKSPETFDSEDSLKDKCSIGGYVLELDIRESKKGRFAKLVLENNYQMQKIILWSEQFEKFDTIIENSEKSLILINGQIQWDSYGKCNVLQSGDSTEIMVLN